MKMKKCIFVPYPGNCPERREKDMQKEESMGNSKK
jgi:hypothetical protein